jgi:hypothetical protein
MTIIRQLLAGAAVKRLVLLCALTFPLSCAAASGFVKGQVEIIRTHDAVFDPAWAPPRFWFALKGISQAGGCPQWHNLVLFAMNDKQALSVVLAAQASGQEIAVAYDDTRLSNGWCAAGYVTIGNPAPLY